MAAGGREKDDRHGQACEQEEKTRAQPPSGTRPRTAQASAVRLKLP
jgi:hypothetical protein